MIRSDRTYSFPADPDALWARLDRVEDYRMWWPWLRQFEAQQLKTGETWACLIKPPVPWSSRMAVEITEAVPSSLIAARVTGEVTGEAQLDIQPSDAGSEVRIRTRLAPASAVLRAAAYLAAPLSRFGHDWVLDTGSRQFRAHLAGTA
jgi:uncharacterized protein YndB with AHSA1/START domain